MPPEHNLFSSCPAPAFKDNNIAVFLTSDNNFAPYLSVAIASIAANSSAENNYDILVLDDGLTRLAREKVQFSLEGKPNFSLRFLDAAPVFAPIDSAHLHTSNWSRATYGRLFIQNILKKYERIVYLDCDVVVLADLAELFRTDLNNNLIAGVRDYAIIKNAYAMKAQTSYYQQVLGLNLKQMDGYVNAGVMVMDLKAMREVDLEASFRDLMKTIPKPQSPDQDIINVACTGRIKYLDLSWNTFRFLAEEPELLAEYTFLPEQLKEAEIKNAHRPRLIHFTGPERPWRAEAKYAEIFHYFWRYARLTTYYESMLIYATPDYDLLSNVLYYPKLVFRCCRYSALAALPFKSLKRKYESKAAKFQQRLNRCRRLLSKP